MEWGRERGAWKNGKERYLFPPTHHEHQPEVRNRSLSEAGKAAGRTIPQSKHSGPVIRELGLSSALY
jgi:hypothetical protein